MTKTAVHRVEVRPRPGTIDARGEAALEFAAASGGFTDLCRIDTASVYLIEAALDAAQVQRIAGELLASPVTQEATVGAAPPCGAAPPSSAARPCGAAQDSAASAGTTAAQTTGAPKCAAIVEVHPLPGVMDPDAEALETAIAALVGAPVRVRTGRRFDLHGLDDAAGHSVVERCFANPLIHDIHAGAFHPDAFQAGTPHELVVRDVPLLDLDDAALQTLSRDAHLFLDLEEMQTVQAAYRAMGREPRDIELETIAQTWSEHCVHKTLKATIRCTGGLPGDAATREGHEAHDDGAVTIHNLLRSTIAHATKTLMADGIDWCLSVFVDNAGIVAFDDDNAVCFKVETHNHPSALEPYGGAATGIGGCIRDIIGTGLAAQPIAATDVFCVAPLERGDTGAPVPAGCLPPRRVLSQVVAGVRDYGNRMGIPTLNGTVWFDDDYIGNPLVFCGCVGVMPRDRIEGDPIAGDHIIALGGRTGRDGIHGATFSSAELTDTHADEFSHAVQIGNPITEKKVLDAIIEARGDGGTCLFRSITDCGAGGFSSAVGEMGEQLGAVVQLERAPLKYEGLSPTEIWISEAQERMVLAVPTESLDALAEICERHDVDMCDLGTFGAPDRMLILNYGDTEVGRVSMELLHDGLPGTTRDAHWTPPVLAPSPTGTAPAASAALLDLLAHPNIASKRCIIRQYDHEVQGRSVVPPLVGPAGEGPSDAAVVLPVAGSTQGLAIGNGLATGLAADPYLMALAAADECVRNIVCVGGDPSRIAILDNFCWPGCNDPDRLGALVRAAEGCHDAAMAYRTPFISGKDSLNNQFTSEDGTTIRIPPTLLISGFGVVPDVMQCVTMDAKQAGNVLVQVGTTGSAMGGSHYARCHPDAPHDTALPETDLARGPATARAVADVIAAGLVRSAHDLSEGGLLVAAAEMAFSGEIGLELDIGAAPASGGIDDVARCFAETPSRYLLEVAPGDLPALTALLGDTPHAAVGTLTDGDRGDRVVAPAVHLDETLDTLRAAWLGTISW